MWFTSDNASGAAPQILHAMITCNDGCRSSYGNDASMAEVKSRLRDIFEAPEAEVYLVTTGTVANALSLALMAPPWTSIYAHTDAHVAVDECGAPEFYTHGAKLTAIAGPHGKMSPENLRAAIARTGEAGVHGVQKGALSITNVTEAGTVYSVAEVTELAKIAKSFGVPVHMDGARFANALVSTGASPSAMTWRAGVDILSFGGTKNGCMGVEAVILFDPAKAWEFELRRKRAGHLMSKHRYLSAQMQAYLQDGLWLTLATHANKMGARLAQGLGAIPNARLQHPVDANMLFPIFPEGTLQRLDALGARYAPWPSPEPGDSARFVASWATGEGEVDALLDAIVKSC